MEESYSDKTSNSIYQAQEIIHKFVESEDWIKSEGSALIGKLGC